MENMWGNCEFGWHSKKSKESFWNFYFGYFISPVFFMCEPPVRVHMHSNYFAFCEVFVVQSKSR